jgi:hypothetical protein
MVNTQEAPQNRIIRVFNDKGREVSQKKVILRAGDLASSGEYGTVNVNEENLGEFTELMKTRVEIKVKPGNLRTLFARLTGSNPTERIRTFDKEWTPQIMPIYLARAMLRLGTDFEKFQRQTDAYMKEHPEILLPKY